MRKKPQQVKTKVAFVLDHKLHHYRASLFEQLGKFFDVTVLHRGPQVEDSPGIKQIIVNFKKMGLFEYISDMPEVEGYDSIIIMQNLRVLNLYFLPLKIKKSKLVMWGIGTSSSKGLGSESSLSIMLRNFITLFYSKLALYSSVPINNYWSINKKKITVVGNSIVNEYAENTSHYEKEYFLFIGSLNKRKGLNELLESFRVALVQDPTLQLKIVGDGPEKENLKNKVTKLKIEDNVEFLGAIYSDVEKTQIFKKAYCVISPLQAGLSVVESFSYGVPFVTSATAITGGESQSIINKENGILFDNISQLSDIILSFVDGHCRSSILGNNAYHYYLEHLKFDLYVERFKKLINED